MVTPIANWQQNPDAPERVIGTWDTWVLTEREVSPSGLSRTLSLHNLQTGERRVLTNDASPDTAANQAIADGRVAWMSAPPPPPTLHVYDIASQTDSATLTGSQGPGPYAIADSHVAWLQGGTGTAAPVIVHDLTTGTEQTATTVPVNALALSSDGRFLAWIESATGSDPGLFVRDLTTGDTVKLLDGNTVGSRLSVSGHYLAWGPRPGSADARAGFYNTETHEIRLVQPTAGPVGTLGAVMGDWFVWVEGPNQPQGVTPVGTGGLPSPLPACCYYFLKLGP
jgi:hypothetical protein